MSFAVPPGASARAKAAVRVFLMDDDEEFAARASADLTALGYEIVGVTADGASALARLAAVGADVVVVGLELRGPMSGLDVADRIELPVVLVAARDDADVGRLVDHEGVIGFQSRPCSAAHLAASIELVLMQQRARARHLRLERHYQLLFDQAAVGVAMIDGTSGRVIDVNRKAAAIFGATVSGLLGRSFVELGAEHDRSRLTLALALDGEQQDVVVEVECRREDGAPVWTRLSVARLPSSSGDARDDLVVMVEDVSDRERAAAASRAAELRERLAVEASRAKTNFLAHMSHELRTPLNAILGLSEALGERVFGDLDEDQLSAVTTIHQSGRHLLELINDILDLARVEAGKLAIETEQIELPPLLDECVAMLAPQVSARGQRLRVEPTDGLPPLDIDRRRIKQVLLNLLDNAMKFAPAGAELTLRTVHRADERVVTVAVSDQGPGIPSDERDRIFEPFVRLAPLLRQAHGGAGLGLPLARRIVELHGGTLTVDSEVGRGSTFTFSLPVAAAYEAPPVVTAAPEVVAPAPASPGRGTVLLAEDDQATAIAVRSYLQRQGYQVRVVDDGLNALDAAAAPDVAVVLMDVRLPRLDGLEVIRRLRVRRGSRPPVIALTAHALPGDEARCLAAGANAYLAKPVRLRLLADTVRDLLGDPS